MEKQPKQGFKKYKMANLFWEKNMEKQPTGIKFAPKIIPAMNTWSRTEGHSDMTVGCVPT